MTSCERGNVAHPEHYKRHGGIYRLLLLMELLCPLKYGATLKDLHHDMSEELSSISKRTVYRDLHILRSLTIVELRDQKWRWTGSPRASLFKSIVENYAEQREESEVQA